MPNHYNNTQESYPLFAPALAERKKIDNNFFLKAKLVDISTGKNWIVVINYEDAKRIGILPGDELVLSWKNKETEVGVDISSEIVKPQEVGIFKDISSKYKIKEGDLIKFTFANRAPSLQAIYKKLFRQKLTYKEILSIIDDIVKHRLNDIEIAFFIASAFDEDNFSEEELYYLTKAIAQTGDTMKFEKITADKHSTGGLPGNRVTPIIVPIVASFGVCIPKTSSRSITSAAGTADAVETIMNVKFNTQQIYNLVKKNKGCLVWGGALNLAPADDYFIKITHSLGIEPYSKMVVSVMAKKVAMGITHLIIDIPVARTAKIPDMDTALKIKNIFLKIAKEFNIKIEVVISESNGPIGRGIGPALEMRDVLRVLQQKDNRPMDLENKAIKLTGILLELTNRIAKGHGENRARENLISGVAWKKMMSIIDAQGGNPTIDSEQVIVGEYKYEVIAENSGLIQFINNQNLVEICRLLGAPELKGSGIYLNKNVGEKYQKGDVLFTLYSESEQRLNSARGILDQLSIFK